MSNIVKGSGLIYTTGQPNTIPVQGYDSEFAIDVNGNQYAWNRTTSIWDNLGQAIEIATSSIAPTHTPSNFRPRFVVTPNRTLYFHSGSAWGIVTPPGTFSGSGQVGPTGIYSGSGTIPNSTVALSLFEDDPDRQIRYLFSAPGLYQQLGDNFAQTGIESADLGNDIYTFAGFQGDGDHAVYRITSTNEVGDLYAYFLLNKENVSTLGTLDINLNQITGSANNIINLNHINGIRVLTSNGKGIQYVDNYTGSFVSSSLINKLYADKQISLTSSFAATSASFIAGRGGIYNGSGDLSGTTVAQLQSQAKLHFKYPSGIIGLNVNGKDGNVSLFSNDTNNYINVFNEYLTLGSIFPSGVSQLSFDLSSQAVIFSDNRSTPLGIEYEANYSSTFTSRSLVDKEYVDSSIPTQFDPWLNVTDANLSGSKGAYTYQATFTPTRNKIYIRMDTELSFMDVIVESGSYKDGHEIDMVLYNTPITTLSIGFPTVISQYDTTTNSSGNMILKWSYNRELDGWLLIKYLTV